MADAIALMHPNNELAYYVLSKTCKALTLTGARYNLCFVVVKAEERIENSKWECRQ